MNSTILEDIEQVKYETVAVEGNVGLNEITRLLSNEVSNFFRLNEKTYIIEPVGGVSVSHYSLNCSTHYLMAQSFLLHKK